MPELGSTAVKSERVGAVSVTLVPPGLISEDAPEELLASTKSMSKAPANGTGAASLLSSSPSSSASSRSGISLSQSEKPSNTLVPHEESSPSGAPRDQGRPGAASVSPSWNDAASNLGSPEAPVPAPAPEDFTRVGPMPSRGLARFLPANGSQMAQQEQERGAVLGNTDLAVRMEARFDSHTRGFLFRSFFLESQNISWANLFLRMIEKHFSVPEMAFQNLTSTLFVYDIRTSGKNCEATARRLSSSRVESFDAAIDAQIHAAAKQAGALLPPEDCAQISLKNRPRITFALTVLLGDDPSTGSFAKLLHEMVMVERGEKDRNLKYKLNFVPLLMKLVE